MKIVLDPTLVEEVVLREMKRKEDSGDLSFFNQYRSRADVIYDLYEPEAREIQFQRLHEKLFYKWGFEKFIVETLNEFPDFMERIELMVVKNALTKSEEGADLVDFGFGIADFGLKESKIINPKSKIQNPKSKRAIGLKILADRFENQSSLQRFLRHELMHISDMLDEEFGYKPQRLADSPMEENIIRDRYKTLWDIYIDSRLEKAGKESVATQNQRYSEFESLYRKLSPTQLKTAFDNLWKSENLSHDELLRTAKDTTELLIRTSQVPKSEIRNPKSAICILPGSPCPLCRFPSYHWAEEFSQFPEVVQSIKEDFPTWKPEDGCCERCAEMYMLKAISY